MCLPMDLRTSPGQDVPTLFSSTPLAHMHARTVIYQILAVVSDTRHDSALPGALVQPILM